MKKEELEFNRLCTVLIKQGGFKRVNGTMDSYEQALWLRTLLAQKDKEVADARRVATIEAWNDAIELSDKLEESDTKFDEWRAFKGFRNGLRDRIRELQTPPDQTETLEKECEVCKAVLHHPFANICCKCFDER